jgi:cell division protein FtsN
VVVGCVIFGVGVAVGAMLGPLAGPKRPASKPKPPAQASVSSPKRPAKPKTTTGRQEKPDRLTFFQTLKEAPVQSKKAYVPFKPTGSAPPPLEALAQKEREKEEKPPEAAKLDAEKPAKYQSPQGITRYYVQVAAFQYRENARRLTQELRNHGYSAVAVNTKATSKPNRVKVGPYESRKAAYGVADRLQRMFLYPTSVVTETKP